MESVFIFLNVLLLVAGGGIVSGATIGGCGGSRAAPFRLDPLRSHNCSLCSILFSLGPTHKKPQSVSRRSPTRKRKRRSVQSIFQDQRLQRNRTAAAESPFTQDYAYILARGGVPLERTNDNNLSPSQLLHGGEHYDDTSRNARRQFERLVINDGSLVEQVFPREKLHRLVTDKQLKRPKPASWGN
jgi:hypothetical protein